MLGGVSSGGSRIFQMGAPTPEGCQCIFWFFCRKLHENGRNWSPGACVPGAPLDPPMLSFQLSQWWIYIEKFDVLWILHWAGPFTEVGGPVWRTHLPPWMDKHDWNNPSTLRLQAVTIAFFPLYVSVLRHLCWKTSNTCLAWFCERVVPET